MAQTFKQQSNIILAIAFAGLIIISQLMVMNMGYAMPWYFLAILAVLCSVILWGMLVTDCTIEQEVLSIKSGPFKNRIDIKSIERLIKDTRTLIKRKNTKHQLTIIYDKNKRLSIFPIEKEAMIKALKQINPAIKVE